MNSSVTSVFWKVSFNVHSKMYRIKNCYIIVSSVVTLKNYLGHNNIDKHPSELLYKPDKVETEKYVFKSEIVYKYYI
jgi:hypothetical protein